MENISHSIFLSSSYEEFVGEERIENATRASMLELAPTLPVALVAVEKLRASLDGVEMVLDACTTAITECTLFVLLIGTNHGSGVMFASGTAISSYLEMEIFTAAIQGKPILVLQMEGVEPHPQLKELLDRFRTSFSSEEYFIGNRKQLGSKLVEVAKILASQGHIRRNKQLTSLPDFLASRRSHMKSSTELSDPKLRFLDNQPMPQGVSTSERKSTLIASEVLQGQILKHGSPQLMTQGAALFRIWAAMRELGGALGPNLEDSKVIPEWDNLLELWQNASSWYGLHGYLHLSPIAAINTRIHIRTNGWLVGGSPEDLDGARASSLYSLAHHMHSIGRRRRGYDEASKLAFRAFQRQGEKAVGCLIIKCHANIRLAMYGSPLKLFVALDAAMLAISIYDRVGADDTARGEALVSRGFCRAFTGKIAAGKSDMRNGLQLMSENNTPNGRSFVSDATRPFG